MLRRMMTGLIVLACGVQLWTAQPARAQYYQTDFPPEEWKAAFRLSFMLGHDLEPKIF
jgi:hypothetical protein